MGTYVTAEVRALIGTEGPRRTLRRALGHDELRRFAQGVMESDPVHWDENEAHARGYDDVVAPPLYVLHAFRREDGTPDPLDQLREESADWDGTELGAPGGLEMPDIPLKRVLNGGTEAEFFQMASVGDVISAQTRYADIAEREGRSGPMVLVIFETTYTNQDDIMLARVRTTSIMR
jgi:hydroxyacyl-ACP dehydratase HTD2-like protein with hotdog domain